MNWEAFNERENNKRYITGFYRQGHLVLEVQTKKVSYQGRTWLELSDYAKRKFETGLFIERMGRERIPLKILYV